MKFKKFANGWSFHLGKADSACEIAFRWFNGKGLRLIIHCRRNWLIRLTGFNQWVWGI